MAERVGARYWTRAEAVRLREEYPTSETAALAASFGCTLGQLRRKVAKLKLKKSSSPPRAIGDRMQALRAVILAAAAQPCGVANAEISGYTLLVISNAAHRMLAEGLLFRARLSRKTVRWFSIAAAAEAYQIQRQRPGTAEPTSRMRALRAPWPDDAEPVITAATKYTIAPPPPERLLRTNTHSNF